MDLLNRLFPPHSIVILKNRDGSEIRGVVQGVSEGGVSIHTLDGTELLIDSGHLNDAEYLYAGFPETEIRDVPTPVNENGTILSFKDGQGYVSSTEGGRFLFRADSLVSPVLKEMSFSSPDSLVGQKVFFLLKPSQGKVLPKPYILDVSSLDVVLDQIVLLAQNREVEMARLFCESLLKMFPQDSDILSFLHAIDENCFIDLFGEFPDYPEDMLMPRGRIARSSNSSYLPTLCVVDQESHRELFLHQFQLSEELRSRPMEEIIGLPVCYSVKNDTRGYVARTVIPPMTYYDARKMVDDLERKRLPLSALDLLRIIVSQFPGMSEDDERRVREGTRKYSDFWDDCELPAYVGEEKSRLVKVRDTVALARKEEHRTRVECSVYPEFPFIDRSGKNPNTQEEPAPVSEPSPASVEETPAEAVTEQTATAVVEETTPEMPVLVDEDDLFSLDDCPSGDTWLAPNALAVYRYRSGIIHSLRDGVEKRYVFSLDDFLDDNLREEAENFQYAETYFKKRVLCLFDDVNDQASCICMPGTVIDMLGTAKELLSIAYEMPHQPGNQQALTELKRALGYTQLVLNEFPSHTLASTLRAEIHSVIQRLEDVCYKAPIGALPPTGVIYQIAPNGMIRLADAAYPKGIMLSPARIVDKDYRKYRPGDELVYSIYSDNDGRVSPRFVHLARTIGELLAMANEWANEGEIENAWGIVMNILDAEPNHEVALARKAEYEQMTNEDGSPAVSLECRSRRNATVRTDSFALAERHKQRGRYRDAILNYQAALASARDNEPGKKIACIQTIINLYSQLLRQYPDDKFLRDQYRQFGTDNLLISGKSPLSFRLVGTKLPYLETIIRFYEDMGDALHLAHAYEQKKKLVANPPKELRLPEDKYRILAAEVMANISWNYIRAGLQTEASQSLEEALAHDSTNRLAIQCRAVLSGRTLSERDGRILTEQLQPFSLTSLDISEETLTADADRSLLNPVMERFRLLGCLQKRKKKSDSLLANYLTTLLVLPADYKQAIHDLSLLPLDCQVIKQLDQCMRKGIEWNGWNDIRLACVFSCDAARSVCRGMFFLDKDFLRAWLLTFPSTPPEGIHHQTWTLALATRNFQRWCKAQYDAYNRSVEPFRADSDRLEDLMKQFGTMAGYGQQPWMQKDDLDWAFRCRRLSESIDKYSRAVSSRESHDTYAAIKEGAAWMMDRLCSDPTVLSYLTCYPLLKKLDAALEQDFAARHFVEPIPCVKLVTASDLREDRTMLVELVIETPDNADRMDDCELSVVPTSDVQYNGYDSIHSYSDRTRVYGGEPIFYFVRIRLGQYAVLSRQACLQLSFSFQSSDGNRKEVPLKLDIPVTDDFQPYMNPYSNFGDMEKNPARFYGRDKDVKEVVDALNEPGSYPHFLIYGQKRSGKSSLLYHIQQHLDNRHFLSAEMTFLSFKIEREEDIYYHILSRLWNLLDDIDSELQIPDSDKIRVFPQPSRKNVSLESFTKVFVDLKREMAASDYWKDCKIVLFIDEFTKAYEWLLSGAISNDFLQHWKGLVGQGLFCSVLVGQDTLPAFAEASGDINAFAVYGDKRLNFLPREDAKRLVTEPIIEVTGDPDVFVGDAVGRVLHYSAGFAYHTKWICRELIKRMNLYELRKITESDVDEAVREGIFYGPVVETRKLVDPLTSAGLDRKYSGLYSAEQAEAVLDIIANAEWKSPQLGCYKNYIMVPHVDVSGLLKDLWRRDVVLFDEQDYYTIRVKLYLLWVRRKLHGIG